MKIEASDIKLGLSKATVGVPLSYVRFKEPVQAGEKKEPMYEFKLVTDNEKYRAENILYTQHGVLLRAQGETLIIPLGNVGYCRV